MAPLPQVDFPTIQRWRRLAGREPQTMASAVATPLERQFGRIAGVNQMTSSSQLGSTGITLQFDLNRNIDAAARDVQAAINAARSQLAANLPSNPELPQSESRRRADPDSGADVGHDDRAADVRRGGFRSSRRSCRRSKESARCSLAAAAQPAVRVEVNPTSAEQARHRARHGAKCAERRERQPSQGRSFGQVDAHTRSRPPTSSSRRISIGR